MDRFFRTVLAVALVLYGLFAWVTCRVVLHDEEARVALRAATTITAMMGRDDTTLRDAIGQSERAVRFLSSLPPIEGIGRALAGGGIDPQDGTTLAVWKARLESIARAYLLANDSVFQVRLIGVADGGRELVRVVQSRDGVVTVVDDDGLQRKGDRPYFLNAIDQPEDAVYVSPIDLNVEGGVIEQPPRPTIRTAMPVRHASGDVFGVVVINTSAKPLLDEIASGHDIPDVREWVTDAAGHFLWHPEPTRAFEHLLTPPGSRWQEDFTPASDAMRVARLPATDGSVLRAPDGRDWLIFTHTLLDPHDDGTGGVVLHSGIPISALVARAWKGVVGPVLLLWTMGLLVVGLILTLVWRVRKTPGPLGGFDALFSLPSTRRVPVVQSIAVASLPLVLWVGLQNLADDGPVSHPFIIMIAPVVIATWWAGTYAGLVALTMAALGAWDLSTIETPAFDLRGGSPIDMVGGSLLVAVGLLFIVAQQSIRQHAALLVASNEATVESEAKFRELWESNRDAQMILMPPEWKLVDGNQAAVSLFGARDSTHLAGLHPADLSPEHQPDGETTLEKAPRVIGQALAEGSTFFEHIHRRLDGHEFPCEVTLTRVVLQGVTGVLATIRDISDHRRLEQELREERSHLEELVDRRTRDLERAKEAAESASRAKSAFLANMSHEVRSPMSVVLGYADVLADPNASQSDRVLAGEAIRRNGLHLMQIINDVLDLSRIEAGKMPIEVSNCDPLELLRAIVETYQGLASEKQISLTLSAEEPVPPLVRTDPTRFRQIVMNFVSNALKFTEPGKTVAVTLSPRRDPNGVCIGVADQGIGMTPAQVSRLFVPFEQADTTVTRRYGGTGLGLSISHALATAMGATIEVESTLGTGSTFRLIVPSVDGAVASSISATDLGGPTVSANTTAQRGRILVVEDSRELQKLMAYRLRTAGHDVTTADHGRQGLELALQQSFDVILTDIQMPEMDGQTATRELRKAGYVGPIIGLSAHAMKGEREQNLAAGMDEYLTKPVEPEVLLNTVQYFVNVARMSTARALRPTDEAAASPRPAPRQG